MQFLARAVSRWWTALACIAALACVILPVGLGAFGLWEPQERQLADRVDQSTAPPAPAPPKPGQGSNAAPAPPPPPPKIEKVDECPKSAPKDATARQLAPKLVAAGRDVSDSDSGRRLPFALLGILTVLATAGIAMRTAGPRAGALAGLVLLSMPLLVLQSRQIGSEIGTACGGALQIYGLLALGAAASLYRELERRLRPTRAALVHLLDLLVGIAALIAGLKLGAAAGGGLLGNAAPLGAFAAAGALGLPSIANFCRAIYNALLGLGARFGLRATIGRSLRPYHRTGTAPALLAAALAAVVLCAIAYQVFTREFPPGPPPPHREIFGQPLVATGCWSPALGGIWSGGDDLRAIFDSTFEQIAYGTFPWGILAPVAFAALLASKRAGHARLGALALAWAAATWLATEVFARKVGFALYAGFPALAVAIGGWLDAALGSLADDRDPAARARAHGRALIVAAFAFCAIVDLAKDLESFTEKLTSLLVGNDSIAYPTQSTLLLLSTRTWLLGIGALAGLAFAVAITFLHARAPLSRKIGRISAAVALALTVGTSAFWAFGWQPALSENLSSKGLFEIIASLRKAGDQTVITSDLVSAAHDYAPELQPEVVGGRAQILGALARPTRVFALVAASDRCQLHHEIGEKPYFLLDDRNVHSLLISNKVDGTTDKNPLLTTMTRAEPANIPTRAPGKIVWDNHIQLIGWDIPAHISRGDKIDVTLYYKILGPVAGAWTTIMHFDSAQHGRAFNGDHPPIDNLCATSTWQAGDYLIDHHVVDVGNPPVPAGPLEVWTGFFQGSSGVYKNMTLTEAPGNMRDPNPTDRVKITTIQLD